MRSPVQARGMRYLTIGIDPKLLEGIHLEAEKNGIDVALYIQWCLRTGLFLKELNIYINSSKGDRSVGEPLDIRDD